MNSYKSITPQTVGLAPLRARMQSLVKIKGLYMINASGETLLLADILEVIGANPITHEHIESEAVQTFVYENEARFQRITGQYNPRPLDCIARALPHYGLQLKSDNGIWAGLGARYFVTQLAEDEHESDEVQA